MKNILFFFLLFSISASAQTDTSRMLIRLQFTQDHIAGMGALLKDQKPPFSRENYNLYLRLHDTLGTRIGSGTKPDSVTLGSYPVFFITEYFNRLTTKESGTVYADLRDIINGKTGYTGILQQLNQQVNAGNNVARYLRAELIDLFQRKGAVWTEEKKMGRDFLLGEL